MPRSMLRAFTGCAALLALCACQANDPGKAYENYLARLGNTLGVEAREPAFTTFPLPPRSGSLRLDVSPAKIGTLDFLALDDCALQVTVARRNSSLGLLAAPSQRLLLDLEFLRLAPDCIARLEDKGRAELAAQLESARRAKLEHLPALIFNATLGAAEYRSFWLPERVPGHYPAVGASTVIQALRGINRQVSDWLRGKHAADGREFELRLGEVAGGNGGALLGALLRQADWLAAGNAMLEARMDRGPLCGPSLRHRAADILPNVVRRYFIGEIQPRAALLGRDFHDLLPAVRELEAMLSGALPDEYRQWQQRRDTLFEQSAGAPRRHVEVIKRIQAPCTEG